MRVWKSSARTGGVERLALVGQHLEDLVLPDVDGHREGGPGTGPGGGVAGGAHPVGGGGQAVVRDALHVVAGVQDDGARRRGDPHPLHGLPVEELEALGLGGGGGW